MRNLAFVFFATCLLLVFFFFSSRRRHTRCSRDWSSDVCSSDLWAPRNETRASSETAPMGWILAPGIVRLTHQAAARQQLGALELFGNSLDALGRSEERRVGKECRSRWSPYH